MRFNPGVEFFDIKNDVIPFGLIPLVNRCESVFKDTVYDITSLCIIPPFQLVLIPLYFSGLGNLGRVKPDTSHGPGFPISFDLFIPKENRAAATSGHAFGCFPVGVYHAILEVNPPVKMFIIRAPSGADKIYSKGVAK